jgi:hypothetical protein
VCVCAFLFPHVFFSSLILKRNMIGIGVFSSWSWPKSWRTCQETAFEPPFQDCRIEIEIDSDAATPDMSLGVAARGRQCGRLFPDCDNLKDPLFCAMWHRASKACNMFFFCGVSLLWGLQILQLFLGMIQRTSMSCFGSGWAMSKAHCQFHTMAESPWFYHLQRWSWILGWPFFIHKVPTWFCCAAQGFQYKHASG